ncbi:hypothetical protein LG329_14380 [Virgibacillus necropolis]|uniref:hypothetical protein n=1 Tax=Virgibacillus necropolis TaxID=163877 RepID=UPI00384AF7D3
MYKINMGSFIASIGCIVLFLIVASSDKLTNFLTTISGFHPLYIILIISLITFLFGVVGFGGMHNWISMLRSLMTVLLTLALAAIIIYILIIANLFQIT